MLYLTGAIDRQGKVTDGNTVCDYDAEEIKRQVTISVLRRQEDQRDRLPGLPGLCR